MGLCFRVALGIAHQHTDPPHPLGLLRACATPGLHTGPSVRPDRLRHGSGDRGSSPLLRRWSLTPRLVGGAEGSARPPLTIGAAARQPHPPLDGPAPPACPSSRTRENMQPTKIHF